MFAQSVLPALLAIAVSTFILRITIGYILKPPGTRRVSRRLFSIEPRWIGRRAAMLLYARKQKKQNR
jgi:hypothetical protein